MQRKKKLLLPVLTTVSIRNLSGDLAFSVLGDGGRYSESFLDEMLSRYDKIIRECITKEYLSEIVLQ